MERYSYLKDIPHDFVMNREDTIVIGQKTEVDGQTRYIAKTVDAAHLIDAMTNTVLEGADLPSHLEAMQDKVDEAGEHAGVSASHAETSGSHAQEAEEQANLSKNHAETSEQHKEESAQLKMQCEQLTETSESHAGVAGRHAEAAQQSETKAQEFTEICEGFAGGLVSVLSLNMLHLASTAKTDGLA